MTAGAKATGRGRKGLETSRQVYPALKAYKIEMEQAKEEGKLIAWCGGGTTSIEILHAMDILPQHIDNMAATFAAKQLSKEYCEAAEEDGLPHDFCSYYRTMWGYVKAGDKADPRVASIAWPEPDLIVGSNSVCTTHANGTNMLARHFGVPVFNFDVPTVHPRMDVHRDPDHRYKEHSHIGTTYPHEFEEHYVNYVLEQNKRFIEFLETVTKRKLDADRLKEVVSLSSRASQFFFELQDLRRAVPCPVGGADIMSLVTPSFIWAGTERALRIYQEAAAEARGRVERGEGAIEHEKFRLFFESIPPWYNLGLFGYLEDQGAISVIEAYPLMFCCLMDFEKPLESLARKQLSWLYNYSMIERHDFCLRAAETYHLDGAINWNVICCKIFAGFAPLFRDRFNDVLNLPVLTLDADQADPRDYAQGQVESRIDAFLELLEQRKAATANAGLVA